MKVRKYIVKDMNEALIKIRYELGENALIMSQRKVRKSGIKGFFSKKLVEVTASVESDENKSSINSNDTAIKNSLDAIRNVVNNSNNNNFNSNLNNNLNYNRINDKISHLENLDRESEKVSYKVPSSTAGENSKELLKEMSEMKTLLNSLVSNDKLQNKNKLQEEGNPIAQRLKLLDVEPEVIDYIISEMKNIDDEIDNDEKLKKVLQSILGVSEHDISGPVVFVGPTGVGKTTTIAKLAGKLSLIDNKRVGLITVDTYRIGAVEQLKTYADIMNIPFEVVFNISDMDEAVRSMKDCDVVLIDTTGRSSKNSMQILELRAFIDKVNTDNINLVISCTTKNKDITPIIEGYKKLNFNKVIITKLDETTTYGSIVNIAYYSKKNIEFLTTGQNVPDDIIYMSPSQICNIVLGEDNIC